jgi:hypothetical protein
MGDPFFRDLNAFTRSGVTTHAGGASVDGEAAKTTDLNTVTFHQCITHGIEHRFDGQFGVTVRQLRKAAGEFFNQI